MIYLKKLTHFTVCSPLLAITQFAEYPRTIKAIYDATIKATANTYKNTFKSRHSNACPEFITSQTSPKENVYNFPHPTL